MPDDYSIQSYKHYTELFRGVLRELPDFLAEFFRAIDTTTAVRTRYGYAVDLKVFFEYLINNDYRYKHYSTIREFSLADLNAVKPTDIDMYMEYLTLYYKHDEPGTETAAVINRCNGKARKLAAIRVMFKYFYKREKISNTAPALVDTPKIPTTPIIRLDPNEVADLLDVADNASDALSDKQRAYHRKNRKRDVAILTLFLGTGIRISELIGIDIDDVNFFANEFSVIRKGGKRDVLVFGDETRTALLDYMTEREQLIALPGHENALFLSMQKRRITVRAVENLVEKYAAVAVPQKHITPHKLRSTFGTMLYSETSDIYLVADILGHKDVNTTKRHYADIGKDRRRVAAEIIKLRGDERASANTSTQPDIIEEHDAKTQSAVSELMPYINTLITALRAIIGEKFTMYLFGSTTLNDYRKGWSDIDILVVTMSTLSNKQAEELTMLRQTLRARENNPIYRLFEGVIMPESVIIGHSSDTCVYWGTSGERQRNGFTLDTFTTLTLVDDGIRVYGKREYKKGISRPTRDETRLAIESQLKLIRTHASETGESLYSAGWLFDIARCLYTLRTNEVISKTAAGNWALEKSLCPCPDEMRFALTLRANPSLQQNTDVKKHLAALTDSVIRFADTLDAELRANT